MNCLVVNSLRHLCSELELSDDTTNVLLANNFTYNKLDEYQHDFRLGVYPGIPTTECTKLFEATMFISITNGFTYQATQNHSRNMLQSFSAKRMKTHFESKPVVNDNEVTRFFDEICQMYTDCMLLQEKYGVTQLDFLTIHASDLARALLPGVKPAVQKMLAGIVHYIESSDDITWETFTYAGYVQYCYPKCNVRVLRVK